MKFFFINRERFHNSPTFRIVCICVS